MVVRAKAKSGTPHALIYFTLDYCSVHAMSKYRCTQGSHDEIFLHWWIPDEQESANSNGHIQPFQKDVTTCHKAYRMKTSSLFYWIAKALSAMFFNKLNIVNAIWFLRTSFPWHMTTKCSAYLSYDVISSYTITYRTKTYEIYVIYIYDFPSALMSDDNDIKQLWWNRSMNSYV